MEFPGCEKCDKRVMKYNKWNCTHGNDLSKNYSNCSSFISTVMGITGNPGEVNTNYIPIEDTKRFDIDSEIFNKIPEKDRVNASKIYMFLLSESEPCLPKDITNKLKDIGYDIYLRIIRNMKEVGLVNYNIEKNRTVNIKVLMSKDE